MGSKLARTVHFTPTLDGTISDRARIVLNHMCWSAYDDPKDGQAAAEYWGGHIVLGHVLMGMEKGGTTQARQAVRRAVKELLDAGLIEKMRDGDGRNRAVYKIVIGGRWKPAKAVDNSDLNGHQGALIDQ